MQRARSLSLREECRKWAVGPVMQDVGAGAPLDELDPLEFLRELDELATIFETNPRRTTARVHAFLSAHAWSLGGRAWT